MLKFPFRNLPSQPWIRAACECSIGSGRHQDAPPERIADEERAFRIEQTNYARGSVWLEGIPAAGRA
jgi:hypothetical protein